MTEKQILKKRVTLCHMLGRLASDKGLTHEVIAERTGYIRSNVTRVLSGRYAPTLDVLINIADAIGVEIVIE